MNNQAAEPVTEAVATPSPRRRRYIPRKVCLAVIFAAVPVLLWLEMGKPILTDDPVLAPLMSMTITRMIGAVVFLALLLHEGYHVLHPLQKPFWKGLLFALPPFLVVVNNMPILSMIWGDAYLVHNAPVYLIWFAAECLAIGLFEELAFRGVIFLMFAEKRHATRKGLFWSLILSSAVFGGVHLVNVLMGAGIGPTILQIGYSFLIGAMCSVVLLKTRNIWICVMLHAIYDFCGTLMPTLGAGTWWDTPTVVFTAVLAVATAVYLVWQFFRLNLDEVGKIFKAQRKGSTMSNEWKNVADQQGIEDLMKTFGGFHDSCITSLSYESGLFVDPRGAMGMGTPEGFALRMVFHSQWHPRAVELCFGGVRSFHIVGLQDNYMNDIYDAYLAFHEGLLPSRYGAPAKAIVWADWAEFDPTHIPNPLEEPGTSYVIASTLQWRVLEE